MSGRFAVTLLIVSAFASAATFLPEQLQWWALPVVFLIIGCGSAWVAYRKSKEIPALVARLNEMNHRLKAVAEEFKSKQRQRIRYCIDEAAICLGLGAMALTQFLFELYDRELAKQTPWLIFVLFILTFVASAYALDSHRRQLEAKGQSSAKGQVDYRTEPPTSPYPDDLND